MILCGFMGFMGIGEVEYANLHCYPQIKKQLNQDIIRIDLPKRKKNVQPYYTFIAGDALEALREYLATRTDEKEYVWIGKYGEPIERKGYYKAFNELTKRIGLVPKKRGPIGSRYGYNPHEMRDLARSLWHQSGADRDVAEFIMGHNVDPLKYDKIYTLDPNWVKEQYRKALPYLNIISVGASVEQQQDRIHSLEEQLREHKDTLIRLENLIQKIKGEELPLGV